MKLLIIILCVLAAVAILLYVRQQIRKCEKEIEDVFKDSF
jgi:hypothetical protein